MVGIVVEIIIFSIILCLYVEYNFVYWKLFFKKIILNNCDLFYVIYFNISDEGDIFSREGIKK